jgi:DNA topoisomerase IB
MAQPAEKNRRDSLIRGIEDWKRANQEKKELARGLHGGTKSYFVQIITRAIQRDAEKHEEILQSILDCMDCTVTMTPEDLGELTDLIGSQLDAGKKGRKLAAVALKEPQNYITKHLFQYILDDEETNATLMERLNKFKGQIYPYA